jgi:hypothetical protein
MTQRERHTPAGGADEPLVTPPPHPSPAAPAADRSPALVWEDLPRPAPPAPPADPDAPRPADRRALLAALLHGKPQDLTPVRPPPAEAFDAGLDPAQREALARALHTPDVCLVQGLPGTGKSRVVARLVAAAAAAGRRVLLLAPGGAALDRALEQVGPPAAVCPVRLLAVDERADALPPCLRRLTLPERQRFFDERTVLPARRALAALDARLDARRRDFAVLERLRALAPGLEEVRARHDDLLARRARVPAAVAAAAEAAPAAAAPTPFQAAFKAAAARREIADRLDERAADLRAEAEKLRTEREAVRTELDRLRPLAEAKLASRFWSPAWWRATFRGDVVPRTEELRTRNDALAAASAELDQRQADLDAERARADAEARAEAEALRDAEARRILGETEAELAAVRRELAAAEESWQRAASGLSPEAAPPAEHTAAALEAAGAAWRQAQERDEAERAAARRRLDEAEAAARGFAQRLASRANVVAAPLSALAGDPVFGDRAAPPEFDLLVLDEADQVTETEFLAAARRASHWVLIGEPAPDCDAGEPRSPGRGTGRPLPPAALRPGFFQRLWRSLHPDPRDLPCAWVQANGQLTCYLRPVPHNQRHLVHTERLVDRPDIELHIYAPPRKPPELAAVVFPPTMTIHQAKEYLFREVEEPAVQAYGPAALWEEDADKVVLRLAADGEDAAAADLGGGVRERVGPLPCWREPEADGAAPWQTCALEFERAAGWDRRRAEEWVEQRLRWHDAGRTAFLSVPHRMERPLAALLSDLLFDGGYRCGDLPRTTGSAAELIAVPPWGGGDGNGHRRAEAGGHRRHGGTATAEPRLRSVRGGAGLELDLADTRRPELLPADLRAELPAQGLVNYLEARAVVQALEGLVSDPSFQAAARAWLEQRSAAFTPPGAACPPDAPHPHPGPAAAVIALYPAQVDLLRRLAQRSDVLGACPLPVEVGLPADFAQRECYAALVSLTRSHTHRAVTFGGGPQELVLALTRASARLLLFGDPGTLIRRTQWQGPVDHLDEPAAGRERELITRLVDHMHGYGPNADAFRFVEGRAV